MSDFYKGTGHRKFADPAARRIEQGLREGDQWQIAAGIASRGVMGSARDGGRAVAEEMYRRGDGVPLPSSVFIDVPRMEATSGGDIVPAGTIAEGDTLQGPDITTSLRTTDSIQVIGGVIVAYAGSEGPADMAQPPQQVNERWWDMPA